MRDNVLASVLKQKHPILDKLGRAEEAKEMYTKAIEDLPEDAFQGVEAFRQTGVRTKLLLLTKPNDE